MTTGIVLLILRLALAAVLYAFVAWAFYTLWQDLQRHSRLITSRQAPPISLIQQLNGDSRSFRFTNREVIIGRDPASDLHLEDQTISAQHARLSYHHSQWWVEDLESTNGTFLNHEAVTRPLVVTNGDQLRFGQVLLAVSVRTAPPDEEDEVEIIS